VPRLAAPRKLETLKTCSANRECRAADRLRAGLERRPVTWVEQRNVLGGSARQITRHGDFATRGNVKTVLRSWPVSRDAEQAVLSGKRQRPGPDARGTASAGLALPAAAVASGVGASRRSYVDRRLIPQRSRNAWRGPPRIQ
jgi:hypothetical protein